MKRPANRKRSPEKRPSISIIGAGAVGSTLTSLLAKEGYPVRSVISRSGRSAVALAGSVGCKRASTEIADLDLTADIVLIAVRDADLPGVVQSLSRLMTRGLRGCVVLHTSGVYGSAVLAPLGKRGAAVGSFHPLQTFPAGVSPARLRAGVRGICFGIDGDEAAVKAAARLAADLGGTTLALDPEMRALYHAAGVFASGYLAVVMHAVSTLSRKAGIARAWTEVFGPLMTATMENTVRDSPAGALTGPVLRGDLETIGMHLAALEKFAPEFIPLYTVAALETARIAVGRGTLRREQYDELLSEFRSAMRSTWKPAKR